MTQNLRRLWGATPLESARLDGERTRGAASKGTGDILLIATLLRQAAVGDSGRTRRTALRAARAALGRDALRRGCAYDDRPAESDVDVIRLLAQGAEHAGLLSVAQGLLESAYRVSSTPLERGRVLNERARNSRKMGHLDLCQAQNAAVLQLAREIDSDELRARANFDLGALAQTRGNFVAMKRLVLRGIRVADRAKLGRLAASGYIGLGIHAARHGYFDEAVTNLWKALALSKGSAESAQEVLVNLAQVLLDAGHPAEARLVADFALRAVASVHTQLPALGCLAIAAARVGDRKATHAACAAVRRLARAGHQPREVSGALLDCAMALATLGADAPSGAMYERAMTLATAHGFHDLTFVPRPRPDGARREHDFARPAARIVESLGDLELLQGTRVTVGA
jgi:tetratricopeptide (TPR) repeat protein